VAARFFTEAVACHQSRTAAESRSLARAAETQPALRMKTVSPANRAEPAWAALYAAAARPPPSPKLRRRLSMPGPQPRHNARSVSKYSSGQNLNRRLLRLSDPCHFDLHSFSVSDGATGVSPVQRHGRRWPGGDARRSTSPLRLFPTPEPRRRQTGSHPPRDSARSPPSPRRRIAGHSSAGTRSSIGRNGAATAHAYSKTSSASPGQVRADSESTLLPRENPAALSASGQRSRRRVSKKISSSRLKHGPAHILVAQSSSWFANKVVPSDPRRQSRRELRAFNTRRSSVSAPGHR